MGASDLNGNKAEGAVLSLRALDLCARMGHDSAALIDEAEHGRELAELRALGLVVQDPYEEGKWFLHDPKTVWQQQVALGLAEITAAVDRIEQLPRLIDQLPKPPGVTHAGIRLITHKEEAAQALERAMVGASSYIWTAQPIDRPVRTMEARTPLDVRNLEKGIALRTIYKESARSRPHQAEWAAAVTKAGGEVRTLSRPFLRMIIIDGAFVLVSNYLDLTANGEPSRNAAVLITQPEMIAFLLEVFRMQWHDAEPWLSGHDSKLPETAITQRQREIMRGLTQGKTQAGIARDLSLGERTIRAEIKRLCELYGVKGEFALGRAFERDEAARRAGEVRDESGPTAPGR
ncbi:LuxR C-terminal-related transcriptional regulator [Streptomyces sp. NPDC002668]|uniref:LuxR C-terminal-related transcriptional regulator n=1 Tax=Streptomyces sp. NPDC002668 TaxID=3154422 RepID=UPI00331A0207